MIFDFKPGTIPLLVSIPHNGNAIPDSIASEMTPDGHSSRDTDWFLDRLYHFPELADASTLVAKYSRYVIDLNRPSTNESLYPGQTTTGLLPETCFDGAAIYLEDPPDSRSIQDRVQTYWKPYHHQLTAEMNRLCDQFGFAVLLEAHSIASRVPRLFEGQLPDFNLGTNHGTTCDPELQKLVVQAIENQKDYSHVVNGRFVGGYITRHFGQPDRNWHALQIELSQSTYMDEETLSWHQEKASKVQPVFQTIILAIKKWIQNQTPPA